jgi:hypothetical protein
MKNKKVQELLALILVNVIDENNQSQDSQENELWKLGYQEACDKVIDMLQELSKNYEENLA